MMHDVDLRRRYVVDPAVQPADVSHVGLTMGHDGASFGTHGGRLHWTRVILSTCALLVVGVFCVVLSGIVHGDNATAETGQHINTRSFAEARIEFDALIRSIQSVPIVAAWTDNRTLCTPVEHGSLLSMATLMEEVMKWTNATCFTPLFVGVSSRAVAWGRVDGTKTCAMNARLLDMSMQQSMVFESCPLWDLPAVPVQRPHRVQLRFTRPDGVSETQWVEGEHAHCVQSAYQLWSGHSVHDTIVGK